MRVDEWKCVWQVVAFELIQRSGPSSHLHTTQVLEDLRLRSIRAAICIAVPLGSNDLWA